MEVKVLFPEVGKRQNESKNGFLKQNRHNSKYTPTHTHTMDTVEICTEIPFQYTVLVSLTAY